MYITVEPAGLMMHTVKLVFDPSDPAAEDQQVRDYLSEHELEPRYHWFAEIDGLEGRECEIMQFGGCYLGRTCRTSGSSSAGWSKTNCSLPRSTGISPTAG